MEQLQQFEKESPEIYKELPAIQSEKIEKWIRSNVFINEYIFFNNNEKTAICSSCGSEDIEVPKNTKKGNKGICPSCGKTIEYRPSKLGRKKLIQRARVLIFQNKDNSVYATLNMLEIDYINGKSQIYKSCEAVYKFNHDVQIGYKTNYNYYNGKRWTKIINITLPYRQGTWKEVQTILYKDNLNTIFENTDLKYCMLEEQSEEYTPCKFIKLVNLNAKYKSVEKLYKAGLEEIITSKINDYPGSGAIKWKKDNLKDILQLTKPEITKIRELKFNITNIQTYKLCKKVGINIPIEEIKSMHIRVIEEISKTKDIKSLNALYKYLNKQVKALKEIKEHSYYSLDIAIRDYKDYIKECEELGFDIENKMIKFPKNLYEAHQRTIEQIKTKENKEQSEKYKTAIESAKELNYEEENLLIRAIESVTELIEEGKALNHCVGSYAERVANKKTFIFAIRRTDNPDIPYYTLELKKKMIMQCRGTHNQTMTEEIKEFIERWQKEIVLTEGKKKEQIKNRTNKVA